MERLVNLTPHDIQVYFGDDAVWCVPQSGQIARVKVETRLVRTVNGAPIVEKTRDEVYGLPEPAKNTTYVVSKMVLDAAKKLGRTDCVSPDTNGSAVRDEGERLIGVRAFQI